MYFDTSYSVTINGNPVISVVRVKTKRESTHIGASCEIVVPQNCVVAYVGGSNINFLTGYPQNIFSVGDEVTVTAQYVGLPSVQIFQGFVYDFVENMPTTIKCLDYVYNLNLNIIKNISAKTSTFSSIVNQALSGTGVTQMQGNVDFSLQNISLQIMSPAAILDWFKKQLGLNISLQGNQLYANIASNTLDTVLFDTARNVKKSGVQKPETAFQQYQVTAHFVLTDGRKSTIQVGSGVNVDQWFYNIPYNPTLYQQMAEQALTRVKQTKYSGTLTGYLYPIVNLFDRITYTDQRYPDKNGDYVCIGHEYDLSDSGFQQTIKMSYLTTNAA
jgi:hypothetical protein